MSKISVVTGANRGIGREIARQLHEKDFTVIAGITAFAVYICKNSKFSIDF